MSNLPFFKYSVNQVIPVIPISQVIPVIPVCQVIPVSHVILVIPVTPVRPHSVLKGGGARKMLQTAKTFVTKLVRYIEWIVDPL